MAPGAPPPTDRDPPRARGADHAPTQPCSKRPAMRTSIGCSERAESSALLPALHSGDPYGAARVPARDGGGRTGSSPAAGPPAPPTFGSVVRLELPPLSVHISLQLAAKSSG